LAITTLGVLLFALPLALVVGRLDRSRELAELQRDATRIAGLVPDNPLSSSTPVNVPGSTGTDTLIGLYSREGTRAGGKGPDRSTIAVASLDGRVHQGTESGQLVVVVPVPSDRNVVAVVRAAVPVSGVISGTRRSWAAMSLLALTVIAVAALLARRQARRIALPLERLTVAARALGDGNFAINPERSGIAEADAAGAALGETAARLGHLLDRERAFSADASHQLRTPLTGLLLGLESALERPDANLRQAIADALDRGRRLQGTVDDLLTLRRDAPADVGSIDLGAELSNVERQWRPVLAAHDRRLTVTTHALAAATGSPAAVRQILDVLIDNALTHGAGVITVTTEELGDAVAIEIADEGAGLRGDPEDAFVRHVQGDGHGIGLALARSLAEADGGRLVVRHVAPRPVFALLLPLADTFIATRRHGPSPQASSS